MPNDAEPLPEELKAPIAIADDLLLPAAPSGIEEGDQLNSAQQVKTESDEKNNESKLSSNDVDSPGTVRILRL